MRELYAVSKNPARRYWLESRVGRLPVVVREIEGLGPGVVMTSYEVQRELDGSPVAGHGHFEASVLLPDGKIVAAQA